MKALKIKSVEEIFPRTLSGANYMPAKKNV